jgi:hypothetical protein
VAELE